jgi:hypothetical protein
MQIKPDWTPDMQREVLRGVCQGQRWLIVLDDVWAVEHERELACIDAASGTKVLVTTRIRGLLKSTGGCDEVVLGVLSTDESIELLLRITGTACSTGDVSKGEKPGVRAHDPSLDTALREVTQLCGHLPLLVHICGRLICDYGDLSWASELPALLRSDRVEGGHQLISIYQKHVGSIASLFPSWCLVL